MNKTLLIALSTIILGSTYVSAVNPKPTNITMSANDTYTFKWQTCPNNKYPLTEYKDNQKGYQTPDGTITCVPRNYPQKDGCVKHTFTVTTQGARNGSLKIEGYRNGKRIKTVAIITIDDKKPSANKSARSAITQPIPSQSTMSDPLTLGTIPVTMQPNDTTTLSTSDTGIVYTFDLTGYAGKPEQLSLSPTPTIRGYEGGTTYTLKTINAIPGTFTINQMQKAAGAKSTVAYKVTIK